MFIDAHLHPEPLSAVPDIAKAAEDVGFDTLWVGETVHDPFLAMGLASLKTERIKLGTAVAIAFPRSPTVVAYSSWDLQALSKGRFILGLGTQVKGHNERRYSVKWEAPAPRMKEYVQGIRAIFDCWQNRTKLNYQGKYYTLTLMPQNPMFNPGPIKFPPPPIYISALNKIMCRVAGEVCDGVHIHPFHTRKYLAEVAAPAVQEGIQAAGRKKGDCLISTAAFMAAGETPRQIDSQKQFVRQQLSFYGSTRTYKPVLDLHGWGSVCDTLHEMSKRGEWAKMPQAVPDEMVNEFAVSGSYDQIPDLVKKKYHGLLDRVALYMPYQPGKMEERWKALVKAFR